MIAKPCHKPTESVRLILMLSLFWDPLDYLMLGDPLVFNIISRCFKNNHANSIHYLSIDITEVLELSHIGELKS